MTTVMLWALANGKSPSHLRRALPPQASFPLSIQYWMTMAINKKCQLHLYDHYPMQASTHQPYDAI